MQKDNVITETMFSAGQTILLENDYESKIWVISSYDFDKNNPDHFSNGATNRMDWILTQKEAERLNNHIDGDGACIVGIVITKNGLRIINL